MKTITWQQLVLFLACLVTPIAAYKLLGSAEAAAASMGAGMILLFLTGRGDPPAPPPSPPSGGGKVIGFTAALCLAVSSCGPLYTPAEDPTGGLDRCATEAREAHYFGGPNISASEVMKIYEACLRREGIIS